MTYSNEYKEDILSRFHASGMSIRAACKNFDDFPSQRNLSKFVFEEETGLLHPPLLEVPGRCEDRQPWQSYPLETKREAVRLLVEGMEPRHIAKRLNIADTASIRLWAANLASFEQVDTRSHTNTTPRQAAMMFEQGFSPLQIAEKAHVSRMTIYRWLDKAGIDRKSKKNEKKRKCTKRMVKKEDNEPGEWTRAWGSLPDDDPEERARMAEVRLAEALAVLDVLKVPGPNSLKNKEKHRAGKRAQAMTPKVKVNDVLTDFHIARSTYFSQEAIEHKPDKYAALRARIRAVFKESKERYGSESIWAKLREGDEAALSASELMAGDFTTPVIVSEKIVRCIMREEDLIPVQTRHKRTRYNSYKGEVGIRPENLPLCEDGTHNFHAGAPGTLVVTDVTEFKLDTGKVYLSPIIDCYDGCPLSWSVSTHPDDNLCAGSLKKALPQLKEGCRVHTDGGATYFSKSWKRLCGDNELVRSMSRKAKSPDNARAEGFFGTLKQEFFYAQDWKGIKINQFIKLLNAYIVWYRDEKIKKSLGWKTIAAHRATLADAA